MIYRVVHLCNVTKPAFYGTTESKLPLRGILIGGSSRMGGVAYDECMDKWKTGQIRWCCHAMAPDGACVHARCPL
jgi:hypothetical protein